VKRSILALLLLLTACATSSSPAPSAGEREPPSVIGAAEHADDALRAAYATDDPSRLEGVLAGRALMIARQQVTQLARGGTRREERLESRREVHETTTGARAEVVLLIRASQRTINPGAPAPAFSTVLRQWRAGLALQNGRWLVVDDGDLAPAQWWPS
jgi:hypothetical protein